MQSLLLRVMAFILLTSASAVVYALPYLTIADADVSPALIVAQSNQ
jgi:hypothetical protein